MSNEAPGHDVELHDFPESQEEAGAYVDAGDDDARNLNEISAPVGLPIGMNPAGIITDGGIKEYSAVRQSFEEKAELNELQHKADRAPAPEEKHAELSDVTVENEPKATLIKPGKEEQKKISYITLLTRFSTPTEKLLMVVGCIAATAAGVILPLMTIIFGDLTNSFGAKTLGLPVEDFQGSVNRTTLKFIWLGIGMFFATYIYMSTWLYTSENISHRIREAYLASVLRQNIGYFDAAGSGGGAVSTRIITDTQLVQDGIGEKFPMFFMNFACFIAGFVVAFTNSWKLTLVLLCCVPLIGGAAAVIGKFAGKYTREGLAQYAVAGDVAEEAFASIRTVAAFMASEKLAQKYSAFLATAERAGIKKQAVIGAGWGTIQLVIYCTYALAFWYGGKLIVSGDLEVGAVMTVFFSVLIGAFALAGTSSEVTAFSFAVGAGTGLFAAIDRVPPIDSKSKEGFVPQSVSGRIQVEHVKFRYPSRPEVVILHDMTLTIEPGTTCALVGSSGSGKSTIIQLLERFYDPESGTIHVDGQDITKLNVKWLRQQIGYVTQEPILFKGTLWENVADGLIGTPDEHLSKEEKLPKIIEACKFANAHNFITALPLGYDTMIGERGLLLSGGQKQRIAIARAIVKDPKVLLLDEATSALDTESEKLVQEALDRAAQGRTTIVIAHRLSTIRNADQIIVMDQGKIIEVGTHDSLVAKEGGFYGRLVEAQQISAKQHETDEKEGKVKPETPIDPDAPIALDGADAKPGTLQRRPSRSKSVHSIRSTRSRKSRLSVKSATSAAHSGWVFWRTMQMNKPEFHLILLGLIFACITGVTQPVFAVLFGKIILALFLAKVDPSGPNFWAGMFLVIGAVNFFSMFGKFTLFGVSGEKLTTRLRDRSFRSIMRQEIAWFDLENHSVGALTSNLSNRAQEVQNMSGQIVANLLELFASIFGAAIVALVTGWKLGLVVLACLPLLVAANKMRMDLIRKGNLATKAYYELSAQVACEAVAAMRTVAALTKEDQVGVRYHHDLEEPLKIGHRNAWGNTVIYAASQTISFLINALTFWYGGKLLDNGEMDVMKFFTVFMAVTFASQASGRVFSMMPDVGKAKDSASDILDLIARVPPIDCWSPEGKKLDKASMNGLVEFKDVHFVYPNRPTIKVLQGLNLTVKPGQFVALVGPSGCGKSTTVGLIERFYDVTGGSVTIDGVDLQSSNIADLRSIISLVGQEPNLYDMTIKDNIWFGLATEPPEAEIIQAAKDANIHDFIMSLPDGYNTSLGGKGAQLSGGQKQRVAIARALIRKPKVLLLDEATSALDATSEKVVQAALDQAAKGRTTIAIAHRLSTIKNADVIYVFKEGRIAEQGTHEHLISLKGLYYQLVVQQDLSGGH
ncbi:GTPase-activating protein [Rhizophlyctis rosea]|nr:GTPase-activating protein [Rhizophlyctis rosea]